MPTWQLNYKCNHFGIINKARETKIILTERVTLGDLFLVANTGDGTLLETSPLFGEAGRFDDDLDGDADRFDPSIVGDMPRLTTNVVVGDILFRRMYLLVGVMGDICI